jgi:hypothetical protein
MRLTTEFLGIRIVGGEAFMAVETPSRWCDGLGDADSMEIRYDDKLTHQSVPFGPKAPRTKLNVIPFGAKANAFPYRFWSSVRYRSRQ